MERTKIRHKNETIFFEDPLKKIHFLAVCFVVWLMRWSLATIGAVTFSTTAARLVRAMSASAAGTKSPPGALIFLHGLGDTPAGWEDTIQEELPRIHPQLSHLIYRFPHAPTIPISINGGGM